MAGVGRCAWLAGWSAGWLAGRLAASIYGKVSLDQSGACEVAIRYMSLRPAPWKNVAPAPQKPPCPWLNCPREEPPPPPAWIRSVLLDLWLAGGVAGWGGQPKTAPRRPCCYSERRRPIVSFVEAQCRAETCGSFVSVRTCRCLRSSPTDDRAHPSVSTPQLAARGIPDSTSFHSYLLLLLLLFTTPRKQKEWSCYCKYPWRALSVVRSSSSPTPTC